MKRIKFFLIGCLGVMSCPEIGAFAVDAINGPNRDSIVVFDADGREHVISVPASFYVQRR